jgi:antitoxin component of RelBE/YafQ-DinJ toxin-antitoxin module
MCDLEAVMRFSEPMNELIQVRVARDEKRQVIKIARRRGMTLSDFLRCTTTDAAR